MRKFLIMLIFTILFYNSLYALTGNAYIIPEKVSRGSYSETIQITYNPVMPVSWYNGALEIVIPEEFPDLPTLTIGARGEIKVYYLRGGTVTEPVPNSNIFIDGRTVTITSINLSNNDILRIIYGTKDSGGGGVQAPYIPGKYYFFMREKPTDSSNFTSLDIQPSVEVTMIDLIKSANVTSVMAKNTFTFTLTYKNISNTYPVNEVRIWDTLPQGLNLLYFNVTPTSQTNRYLYWNLGSLYYNTMGSLQIVVEAQPGIIEYGQKITNTAKMEASDGYGIYREEAEVILDVFGVKLASSLYATPSSVVLDGFITVLMNVQNQGNYSAYNVSPSALTINGSGSATKVTGPTPSHLSILTQGQTVVFTWIYKATGAGSIYFTGRTLGQENTITVESNTANSNFVNLVAPTYTTTPVIAFSVTPMHTKTFTRTNTPTEEITWTITPTPTDTRQEVATLTPTNTSEEQISPTFTSTETENITPTFTVTASPDKDTPTPTPSEIVIPTATPDALVYIDKNYFNPEKGEKIKIHYKVLEQGTVDIKIYNLSGEIITSYSKNYPYITHDYFYWDGKNNAGKIAGRGIYFVIINQKSKKVINKLIVLK